MIRPLSLLFPLSVLLASTAAPAQHVTTATDFGVLARVDRQGDFRAVPPGTGIGRGLHLRAAAAASRHDAAFAAVAVERLLSRQFGAGIVLREHGAVGLADPNAAGVAGTSSSPPRGTSPSLGRHGLAMQYPVMPGTRGVVTILWRGDASQGAAAGVAVDVDGDGMADFTGIADGNPVQRQFRVTAGRQGVVIGIVSNGRAGQRGTGRAGYAAALSVLFHEAGTAPSCTFTAFGRPCGGQLTGSVHGGRHGDFVELNVAGATPGALGALILGDQLRVPRPLPGSNCNLLVDPFLWIPVRVDGMGNGAARVPLPNRRPIDVDFQVVTLSLQPGVQLASTNGLNFACQ